MYNSYTAIFPNMCRTVDVKDIKGEKRKESYKILYTNSSDDIGQRKSKHRSVCNNVFLQTLNLFLYFLAILFHPFST